MRPPRTMIAIALGLLALAGAAQASDAGAAAPRPGRVTVSHEAPTNPSHQAAHDRVKADPTFARARDFFGLFRLPRDMTIRTRSCSGRGGAWYYEGVVTVCYEYIQNLLDNAASPQRPDWVSEAGAVSGPIADVVLHEGAHALFEFFRTPLFGREEDAADQFATFAILNLFGPEGPAMVRGVAYSYLVDAQARSFTDLPSLAARVPPSRQYGGAHSTALQRMFSVVCHASGHQEAAYADLVAQSELPRWRASGCGDEYRQIAHAFVTLLGPHVDREGLARHFPGATLFDAR